MLNAVIIYLLAVAVVVAAPLVATGVEIWCR
jgi:hypothetical protein